MLRALRRSRDDGQPSPGGGSERRRWPRAAVVAFVGALTFGVAGVLSGVLIDEYGGVLGALEWLLRTLVVMGAGLFIVGGMLVVLRLRGLVRPRPLGWLIAVAAFLAFVWFIAVPVGFGVYLTHLPSRREVRDADLGARKQPVTLTGADDLRLRGWYVPSRNRAAVIALHGTASNRLGVERHARLLARHGYGVLALDLRGHGESDGRSTSAAWTMDEDVGAAVEWLAARRDVSPEKVALLGVSMGGEVAVRVAARRAGEAAEHWNLPDAAHADAIRTDPRGYERRVILFLDRALSTRPASGRWRPVSPVRPSGVGATPERAGTAGVPGRPERRTARRRSSGGSWRLRPTETGRYA